MLAAKSRKLKSECSQDELPLDLDVATILLEWSDSAQRHKETGFSPASGQTSPTILAHSGRKC